MKSCVQTYWRNGKTGHHYKIACLTPLDDLYSDSLCLWNPAFKRTSDIYLALAFLIACHCLWNHRPFVKASNTKSLWTGGWTPFPTFIWNVISLWNGGRTPNLVCIKSFYRGVDPPHFILGYGKGDNISENAFCFFVLGFPPCSNS